MERKALEKTIRKAVDEAVSRDRCTVKFPGQFVESIADAILVMELDDAMDKNRNRRPYEPWDHEPFPEDDDLFPFAR